MSQVHAAAGVRYLNEPVASTKKKEAAGEFSKVLAETLEKELQEKTVMLTRPSGDSPGSGVAPQESTLEQMIFTAAATGEAGDAEIALFMLCTMMQGNEDGEFSQLMGAMAAMLTQVKGGAEPVRMTVMQSDYHPYILDMIDKQVFKTEGTVSLPVEHWKPAAVNYTGNETNRSASNLRQILDQFDVESSERYRPYRNGKDTYCNIFVWDATRALGCEIPHYIDADTGVPRSYPDVKGAKELNANATHDWLINHGKTYGWREVTAEEAQRHANQGGAAVTAWKNPTGRPGHVQVVCPSESGGYDSVRGVTVTQAGSKCYNYTHLSSTFTAGQRQSVRYFIHD